MILNDHSLGTRYDRWLALENRKAETPIETTAEQVAFIEKLSPALCERHVKSAMPSELLCQDTLFVGNLKG
ncbi:hypothetical protein ANOBCDAF_04695 [Pleomorphomonas sp. T1.2MG-36]|nr:hypothetical protein ANOBCDAF_04695 [Pleomorphomonas sp. T1.2MG-36]